VRNSFSIRVNQRDSRAENSSQDATILRYSSADIPGSARGSRAGFGVAPKQPFLKRRLDHRGITKVRGGEDTIAST